MSSSKYSCKINNLRQARISKDAFTFFSNKAVVLDHVRQYRFKFMYQLSVTRILLAQVRNYPIRQTRTFVREYYTAFDIHFNLNSTYYRIIIPETSKKAIEKTLIKSTTYETLSRRARSPRRSVDLTLY